MRSGQMLLLAAAVTFTSPAAYAQTAAAPAAAAPAPAAGAAIPDSVGELDLGVQFGNGLDEVGRFHRYEDVRTGPTVERFRYTRERDAWSFTAGADHVGYRDQRYAAAYDRFGRVSASFEWNSVPLFYSGISQSPFTEAGDGVFRLPDAIQQAVQDRTSTIGGYAAVLNAFETRSRRDVAAARVTYTVTRNMDLRVAFTTTGRQGTMPWSASFGFSNAIELAAPVDQRTNDLNTTVEWSNARGMARLAYDGSWFTNGVDTLIWDNPLRSTDQTYASAYSGGDGSSQGRSDLWPNSSSHTVSAAGAVALPARSRAFGYVSIGSWLQDDALLPHTINTAIPPIPLARQTAEAEARIVAMNYRLTSRPTSMLWLNAQFRLYDYDNRTPHFPVDQYVRLDGNTGTSLTGGSEPFGYTRRFVDVDASFTPLRFVAFRAGYGQEHDDRTFRFLDETTEHVVRASIDSTGMTWGSVRLQYDHASRSGDGLDEEALSDVGEQVSLRQFDISDRTRDRVSAIVQLVPSERVGVTGSLAFGNENRPDAAFGLQDNDLRAANVGVDLTAAGGVLVGLSYGFENYSTRQRSRQANPGPQFDDPTRDWSTTLDEDVHTLTSSLEVPRLTSRAALRVSYDYVHSNATYVYVLPAVSTLTPPQQLPAVRNIFHRASADLRYALTRRLAVGAGYWLDKYDGQDFAFGESVLSNPLTPAFVNIMYQWRPYDVHTGFLRLIYNW